MLEWMKNQEIIIGYFFKGGGSKEALLRAISVLKEEFFSDSYKKYWKIIKVYFSKYNSVVTLQAFREFCRASKISETKLVEIENPINTCIDTMETFLKNDSDIFFYIDRLPELYREVKIKDVLDDSNRLLNSSGYSSCRDNLLKSVSQIDSLGSLELCKEGGIKDEIASFVQDVHKLKDAEDTLFVKSGFSALDNESCGFRGGDVCLISGYAGVGKTAFLVNIAVNAVYEQKKNVLLITTETIYEPVMRRLISRISKNEVFSPSIPSIKLKSGQLTEEEKLVLSSVESYMKMPEHGELFIVQAPANANLGWVRGKMLEYESKAPLHVLLLDDLRNMKPITRRRSEWEEFNELLKDFKALARTHAGRGIPVISPYQVTRESFKEALQNGGRYNLSSLSSSSEAERISDVVLSLWEDSETPGELKVEILKMRDGKKGRVFRLRFDAAYQYMEEIIDLSATSFGF